MTPHQPHRLSKLFGHARLRTQVLLIINIALVCMLAVVLPLDYSFEVDARIAAKEISLREESRVIAAAAIAFESAGWDAVQEHIDRVCADFNATESPGHIIEVRKGELIAITDPASHGHDHSTGWDNLVTGEASSGDLRVRVGERRSPVLADARRAALTRSAALIVGTIIAALVLNTFLFHLVTKPIEHLSQEVQRIGRGELGVKVHTETNRDLADLADSITAMSLELEHREADRNAQLNRARRLQSHLLPTPSTTAHVDVSIKFEPADEIAGDFVDVTTCSNGDILLCIADVVGHGIHAAMGAVVLKTLMNTAGSDALTPAELLTLINQRFTAISLPEDFATMAIIRVRADQSSAHYASAGHEPAIIYRTSGHLETLSSTGLVLGIDPDAVYEQIELQFQTGDRVILLSDGVSEASNKHHVMFGRDRLAHAIESCPDAHADALSQQILDAVAAHREGAASLDDTSVLVFAAQLVPAMEGAAP